MPLTVDGVFITTYNNLKDRLDNERVNQNKLDRCLVAGLQMVQRKDRKIAQVAPRLLLLLQHGAQWRNYTLLEHQMTPYHLICNSIGDHHELLDLMIKISGKTQIDTIDHYNVTALLYAVDMANIHCVRCLITNGADVNKVGTRPPLHNFYPICTPLCLTLDLLLHHSTHSPIIMKEILDLLLEGGADMNKSGNSHQVSPLRAAIRARNVDCVVKMIKNVSQRNSTDLDNYKRSVWAETASMGSVEVVKRMLEHGIDKDFTDPQHGCSLLSWVVSGHNVEAVR